MLHVSVELMKKLWVMRTIKFGLNEPIQNLPAKNYHSKISGRAGFFSLRKQKNCWGSLKVIIPCKNIMVPVDKRINIIVLACIH